MAEVLHVKIERNELTAAKIPALKTLFNLERLPLTDAYVEIEIKGVPTAIVNGLRRTVTDEMAGHCLAVPSDGFDAELTTDVFMLPQFVNKRIALMPLRPQISADAVASLRLDLDVTNTGPTELSVYSGDLVVAAGSMPEPLFNPTFKLAFLQPGKRIVIRGIHIAKGYGRDNGVYLVARRAAYRHLDLAEHTPAEMNEPGGVATDWSGYKVSSLVANPRHHRLTATIPATGPNLSEVRAVFADACATIKGRLRLIQTTVERRAESPSGGFAHRGIQYTVLQLENDLSEGLLRVPGETHTVGEMLRRTVYELAPEIASVAYTIVSHENSMNFTVRHTGDVTHLILSAVKACIETYDALQRGITSARS